MPRIQQNPDSLARPYLGGVAGAFTENKRMDQRQQRREAIKAECVKRGIRIEQRGQSCRLTGPGVDQAVIEDARTIEPDGRSTCEPGLFSCS